MYYLIPFAFLWACLTVVLYPFFFQEPSFFLFFLATDLKALEYFAEYAEGFLFPGADLTDFDRVVVDLGEDLPRACPQSAQKLAT